MISTNSFGQAAIPPQLRAENTLDRISSKNSLSGSDILYGLPVPPGSTIGDNYLNKEWNQATFLLYQSEKMIEGYPAKFDIQSDLFEVKTNNGIKILDNSKVKNVVWIDSLTSLPHYFVNGKEYRIEGVPSTGILEIVVDGIFPLFKKTELFVKEPTYNVAFDVGSRDKKIFQKEIMYYGKDKDLMRVKNKKDVLAAAGGRATEVEAFVKSNKLNLNKETDLKRVFEFLNAK
ncbi:MAG TPA: hypothetical protein PLJ13_05725 [Cyclobacteriaceae bacterium]|nr:hypothetical protein [Cyclobacteriaceae bacterium]